MKVNLKKIWMTLIIFLISLCSCFFLNKVSALSYEGKKITVDDFEKFGSKTLDKLQICAANSNSNDLYFNFDCEKLYYAAFVNGTVEITAGFHEKYYFYWNVAVCCITPEDHLMAYRQKVGCIIDCPGDNTVVVYRTSTKGKAIKKVTTYEKAPKAVQKAYQMAYYAAKSIENQEGPRKRNIYG